MATGMDPFWDVVVETAEQKADWIMFLIVRPSEEEISFHVHHPLVPFENHEVPAVGFAIFDKGVNKRGRPLRDSCYFTHGSWADWGNSHLREIITLNQLMDERLMYLLSSIPKWSISSAIEAARTLASGSWPEV